MRCAFSGDWRPILGIGPGPGDQALLNAPDHSPHVEQQHPANSGADANRENGVRLPAVSVETQEQARRRH